MKYFLATYKIQDGFHEYNGAFVLEAKSFEAAEKIAKSQEHDTETSEAEHKYFDFGDDMTAAENEIIVQISKAEMKFLARVGLAYTV